MVLLKVVKCVLEYHESKDHPYQSAFKAVIEKIGISNLRKSFIEQFETLLKDVHQVKIISGDIFNTPQKLQAWSERKHRELNEMLQIILITSYFDIIQPDEINKLLDLFKSHSFGKQNQFLNASNAAHADLIQKVNYSEIALLMVALSNKSDGNKWMHEIIEKIDEKVVSMHHYQEHAPILLSWMIFKFSTKKNNNDETTDDSVNYGKLGARAVQLNVFDYLNKMITHKQYKDKSLVSKIVHRNIYDNLSFLCELFNADGSFAKHPKIFELFSEVLKMPSIAKDFCKNEQNPIRTLFDCAVEIFPHEFIPLSLLAGSLVTASIYSKNWIVQYLQNLPLYTEQPDDPMYELRKSDDCENDTYILLNDYQPFRKIIDYVIPAGNVAIVREEKGRMFVHFQIKLNYFHALHNEISEMLNSIVSFSEIHESKLHRLETGIALLSTIVKRIENADEITNEMIHPTEMVFDILEKFKVFAHPSLDLMASCVNVCAELLLYFGTEIFRRFANLNVAPSINVVHRDFKTYANGNGFEFGLAGYYLIKIECTTGKYNFLKAYLNFLKKATKVILNYIIFYNFKIIFKFLFF
jgi:nuclear pore complex protein Nup188